MSRCLDGFLSAPLILYVLDMTVGNKDILSYLSYICVLLDQHFDERLLNLSVEVGNLLKFCRKVSNKENTILLLAMYSFLNSKRAILR